MTYSSDVAFSPAVKAAQSRKGSRRAYAQQEESGAWNDEITEALRDFITAQTSVFLATASADGQPYIQHRGGPPGFLRVMDSKTLAFADFVGNRQFITTGNLSENSKAQLLLIDYAQRRRVKIWGTAQVVEGDADLVPALMPKGYKARAEQVILFTVAAWDANCAQHIPQRFEAADIAKVLAAQDAKIQTLETKLAALRGQQA